MTTVRVFILISVVTLRHDIVRCVVEICALERCVTQLDVVGMCRLRIYGLLTAILLRINNFRQCSTFSRRIQEPALLQQWTGIRIAEARSYPTRFARFVCWHTSKRQGFSIAHEEIQQGSGFHSHEDDVGASARRWTSSCSYVGILCHMLNTSALIIVFAKHIAHCCGYYIHNLYFMYQFLPTTDGSICFCIFGSLQTFTSLFRVSILTH
jgi:hypothetical protein